MGNEFTMLPTKRLDDLEKVTDTASSPGNYDFGPYMYGMANGLILAAAIMNGEDPRYLKPPKAGFTSASGPLPRHTEIEKQLGFKRKK